MATPRRSLFSPAQLARIASLGGTFVADPSQIGVGAAVELNSGSPRALVVDILDGDMVVIAWKSREGRVVEYAIHRACIRKVREPL